MMIGHGLILPSELIGFFDFFIKNLIRFRDKDELENIIKLLITDNVVRKKFSGKLIFISEE